MHVRDVKYSENGCERFSGTLYMTTFRLVFAPDNELETTNVVSTTHSMFTQHSQLMTYCFSFLRSRPAINILVNTTFH